MGQRSLAAALGAAFLACSRDAATGPAADPARAFAASCQRPAPLHVAAGKRVPDAFIVVYDVALDDPQATTDALAAKYGFAPRFVYQYALKGFAATLTPEAVAGLRCEAGVAYIEEDQYAYALD